MAEDRSWMYTGRQSRGSITAEWVEKATEFVERAFRGVPPEREAFAVRCPCARCRNIRSRSKYDMQVHLARDGFEPGYTVWVYHGEGYRPRPNKPSGGHPEKNGGLDGKKDAADADGGEQVSQGTKTWEMPLLEGYERSKLRKEDQIEWSYQKYLGEQEKTKQQQQQSAPKTKRLHTAGSSTAQLAEDEGNNVSVLDPELEDTATPTADGPVANPATTASAHGVQIPAGPTARPKRKAGTDWVH